MDTITLKELHQHAGRYARAARDNPVLITDRGHPVAVLTGPATADLRKALPRQFALQSAVRPKRETDSTATVSGIRDER